MGTGQIACQKVKSATRGTFSILSLVNGLRVREEQTRSPREIEELAHLTVRRSVL